MRNTRNNGINGMGVLALALIIGLGALIIFMAGFDAVDANHLGVKEQFGVLKGVQESGLEWTGLFTNVHQYDLRTRKEVVELLGANSAVDKTGQSVFSTINVNYRIRPTHDTVTKLYKNVGQDDVIADRLNINAIIREGFKQATVKYEALEILDKRQQVKLEAKEFIETNFPAEYFEIQDIVITNIDFSDAFKQSIESKKVATQNKLKEQEQVEVVKFQQQQEIEKYKAEAEKLRLQKSQVTDKLNNQKMIEKWDGRLPQYLIITPDSQGMFLQLAQGELDPREPVNQEPEFIVSSDGVTP